MAKFELNFRKCRSNHYKLVKEVGDKIEADEAVLEIATDKVDSEVPSEVSGFGSNYLRKMI
jgi:2-oxoglutarate dehydrogenase E2 component (dihydrolipoamide succinyltransferase)